MRIQLISAAMFAALFAAGAAQAEQTTGKIQSVDLAAMTVTLDNGTVYQVQDNTEHHNAVGGYLPGNMVTVVWEMQGQTHVLTAISPAG
mgnify:CR=1 FL=1